MNLRALLQRRTAIQTELRALVDLPEMTVEQVARFDALKLEAEGLTAQEARIAAVAEMEQRSTGQRSRLPRRTRLARCARSSVTFRCPPASMAPR